MPCTAHVVDLFLADIGRQEWAAELFDWAKQIGKFIKSHHKSLAIFRSKSDLELVQPGERLRVSATMMLTTILLTTMLQLRHALAPTSMHWNALWYAMTR